MKKSPRIPAADADPETSPESHPGTRPDADPGISAESGFDVELLQPAASDRPGRDLSAANQQAEVFRSVREAHLMEATEDYVELIDDLIKSRGEARLVEIAEHLGISQPTASKTLARLQRDGFVTSEPYRAIFLTDKGKSLAAHTRLRHDIVYRFLLALGVSEQTAKRDSEGVEHHVSSETLAAFERVIDERTGGLSDQRVS